MAALDIPNSAWTARFHGPSANKTPPSAVRAFFSRFGTVLHVHHMANTSESIVIFDSKEAADRAAAFGFGSGNEKIEGLGQLQADRERIREEYAAQGEAVAFTAITRPQSEPLFNEHDAGRYDSGHGGYWYNLRNLFGCFGGLVDNGAMETLKAEVKHLAENTGSQQQVAALLLRLKAAIPASLVKDAAAWETWGQTMQLFASGRLSQHVDRFADTSVNELLGCLDTTQGDLGDAFGETE